MPQTEKFIRKAAEVVDRRAFIKRAAAGALGIAGALFGLPQLASASHCPSWLFHAYCCCLCKSPTNCSSCVCVWCWFCTTGNTTYKCCECYDSTIHGCDAGCGGVWKSCYARTGLLAEV